MAEVKLTKGDFWLTGWYMFPQGVSDEAKKCMKAILDDDIYYDFNIKYIEIYTECHNRYWDRGMVTGPEKIAIQKEYVRCALEYHKLFMGGDNEI